MTKRSRSPANLPTPLVEIEARLFAREFLARMRQDFGHGPFNPGGGHAFARRLLRQACEWGPQWLTWVVELAEHHGELAAYEAVMELRAERLERNEPLGSVLAAYTLRLEQRPFRPHKGWPRFNIIQDFVFVVLILELVERFDLKPTRSQIGRKQIASACSITADEAAYAGLLRRSERTFEQLWTRFSPSILPGYRWPHRAVKSF
jgi:hypothetical protein